METNLNKLLNQSNVLLKNIEMLLVAFKEVSSKEFIEIELMDFSGNTKKYKVRNSIQIENELKRLSNNFNNIVNNDNSFILNPDGSYSKILKVQFKSNNHITTMEPSVNCSVNYNSILNNLIYPNVTMPIKIDNRIVDNKIVVDVYDVSAGFNSIVDEIDQTDLEYLLSTQAVVAKKSQFKLETKKQKIKKYGEFDIIAIENTSIENTFVCKLNTLQFQGLDKIETLKIGDLLADEYNEYEIVDIDELNTSIKIKTVTGINVPQVGVNKLIYHTVIDIDKIVEVPIQPNKKLVIFLSTENDKSISFPSKGLKVETNNLTVTTAVDGEMSIYDYFDKYVTNLSEYFDKLIKSSNIPPDLGIKPPKITLDPRNFIVTQINTHLSNKLNKSELEELNTKKEKINNDIKYANDKIKQLENDLFKNRKSTNDEIDKINDEIKKLREEINILEQNKLVLTRKIDNNAIKFGLKQQKPKYRVIGFCTPIDDLSSIDTPKQKIIKYEFQYRYLSKNNDEVKVATYKFYDGENTKDITVSPWNIAETPTLEKIKKDDKYVWDNLDFNSSEKININQVSIPIREGESVEIRVRAWSEAGYPIATVKGDWSNIIKVDFPSELTENSVNLLIAKNEKDLKNSEFFEILNNSGLYTHINDKVIDGQKHYLHSTQSIASGFFTQERRVIPLYDWMLNVQKDIDNLKITKIKKLSVQFVDQDKEIYTIENGQTLNIDAGAYADNVDLTNSDNYGEIVFIRTYIKIVNDNDIPLEVKTLIPGIVDLTQTNAPRYWNAPIMSDDDFYQHSKQIIYRRNVDVINPNNPDLVLLAEPKGKSITTIPTQLQDGSATQAEKNLIYLDSTTNTIKKCKLLPNINMQFVAYTKEHPDYVANNELPLIKSFNHLALFNENVKEKIVTEKFNSNLALGFWKNDKYAVGNNTTGAFAYPIIQSKLFVIGNNITSSLIIQKNSEILIPVIFEYRMIDRVGVINGDNSLTFSDNFEYEKKLGFDLLINNETFSFDINFKAKFFNDVVPVKKLNINNIITAS